jgi:hypothetical protein
VKGGGCRAAGVEIGAYLLLGFISSTFCSKSRAERMLAVAEVDELCEEEEESVESLEG